MGFRGTGTSGHGDFWDTDDGDDDGRELRLRRCVAEEGKMKSELKELGLGIGTALSRRRGSHSRNLNGPVLISIRDRDEDR